MTLTVLEDACAVRAGALARTWTRTHTGLSDGGTAIVPGVGPLFEVTLPAGSYTTREMTDAQEILDEARDYVFYAWKNPQGFASACSLAERYPWTPGAQAFVDYFEQNDAFTNVGRGNHRRRVSGDPPPVRVGRPVRRRPGAEWLEQLVPKDSPMAVGTSASVNPTATTSWITPMPPSCSRCSRFGGASESEVIQSIRFVDGLPPAP